jgi:phage terminase small subunit
MARTVSLRPRQRQFVVAYLACGMNAKRAAIEVGYSEKSASYAAAMLKKPHIIAAIAEEQDRVCDENGIRLGHHLRELEKLRDEAAARGAFQAAVTAEVKRGETLGFYRNATGDQTQTFNLLIGGIDG